MGVPDLSRAQQPQPVPPKKIEYPPGGAGLHLDVVPGAPGVEVLRIFDQVRSEVHLIPMGLGYGKELAEELLAPSVVQTNGNGGTPTQQ